MTFYINLDTNEYPVMEGYIRSLHPNTSFPKPFVPPAPYQTVKDSPQPAFDRLLKKLIEGTPVLQDGEYYKTWQIVDKFAEYTDEEGVLHTKAAQEAAAIAGEFTKKKNELAAVRYAKEIAGITFNGMPVSTDRPSQGMLTGAYTTVQITPDVIIDWKGDSGWVQLNKATIEMLSQAVSIHIQSCFTNEKNISALIDAATTVAELEAIDLNAGWPV